MSSYDSQALPSKQSQSLTEGKWTTGLYDCLEDRDNCMETCFCPCITMGKIAEIIDKGATTQQRACCVYAILGAPCRAMYAAEYRQKLREMYKLPEEPCNDCLVHDCCCLCGLTQEYRELRNRGVDPELGWQGNVDKWNRDGTQQPPIPTSMTRS